MAKKKSRDLSLDNALMRSLPEDQYVKNPLSFSQIRGDFSLSQTNLMIGLVAQMQDKIEQSLSVQNGQMLLFSPADMFNGMLQIEIPLNQLDIVPQRYGDLDAAVDGLMNMKMTYKSVDENGIEYDTQRNIFYEVSVPVDTKTAEGRAVHFKGGSRRKGVVKIKIYEECVKDIFNMKKGYIEHLKGIARLCRCSRTPRLYIYLSAWRKKGHYNADFNSLKEFLGVLVYNKERTKIIKNQYEAYSVFARDVLTPVRDEMKKLAEENLIEFYFDYEPIYKGLKKRGNPDMISFSIIATQKGIDFDTNKKIEKLHSTLISMFRIQPEEWEKFSFALKEDTVSLLNKEIYKIAEQIEKKNITNTHAYVTSYIIKFLGIKDIVEEEEEKQIMTKPIVTDEDMDKWKDFCEAVAEYTSEDFCNVFVTPCSLYQNGEDIVEIMVPNNFVKEQWIKNQDGIKKAVTHSFGNKSIQILLDPDYR